MEFGEEGDNIDEQVTALLGIRHPIAIAKHKSPFALWPFNDGRSLSLFQRIIPLNRNRVAAGVYKIFHVRLHESP
jgi:hypothetical protein